MKNFDFNELATLYKTELLDNVLPFGWQILRIKSLEVTFLV